MKRNDKGFSLVELIVVIAIMVVLAAVSTLSISTVTGKRVVQCAKMTKSVIEKTRVETMTTKEVTLTVKKAADGTFVAEIEKRPGNAGAASSVEEVSLGSKGLEMYFATEEGVSGPGDPKAKAVTASQTFSIVFDRSSGEVKGDDCVKNIWIKNSFKSNKITLYTETGKCDLE